MRKNLVLHEIKQNENHQYINKRFTLVSCEIKAIHGIL